MAILATQRVLTHDYWKFATELVPGDYVFNRKGEPVKITLAQPVQAKNCYEVLFNDYLTICGDDKLCLPLEDRRYRYRSDGYKHKMQFRRPLKLKTVEELLETPLVNYRGRKEFSVPTADPIQLPHQVLPVPPFIFGFWFFARQYDNTMMPSKGTGEFVHQKFKDAGYKVKTGKLRLSGERKFRTTPTVLSHLIPAVPTSIPLNYLMSDKEQRFELLQGILHSNITRYFKKSKKFRVYQKSRSLIYMIQYLADSVGCQTEMLYNEKTGMHTLFIKTKHQLVPSQQELSLSKHAARRFVTSITPIPAQLCVHIETDGEDDTILVGEGFISCR